MSSKTSKYNVVCLEITNERKFVLGDILPSIIPKKEDNSFTKINDQELQTQIAKKIWKNVPLELEQSIGDIIDELIKARILKQKGNFIELSHNLLAKIISEISIDEDILDYYRKHFDSSFQTYLKQKKEGIKKLSLLNSSLVKSIKDDIEIIIGNQSDKKEKLSFWRLSEKRVENKKYTNLLIIFSVLITVGFFLFLINIKDFANNILANENADLKAKDSTLRNEKRIKQNINRNIDSVTKDDNEDLTKKYLDFSEIISKINKDDSLKLKRDFPLLSKQYNELLLNYNVRPFYSQTFTPQEFVSKINIQKLEGDKYMIIGKSNNKLHTKKIYLNTKNNNSDWNTYKEVTAYSLHRKIVFSKPDGLYKKELNNKEIRLDIESEYRNLSTLIHLRNHTFIGLSNDKKIIYKVNSDKEWSSKIEINNFNFNNDSIQNERTFNFINTDYTYDENGLNSIFFIINEENKKPYLLKAKVYRDDFNIQIQDTLDLSKIKSNLKLEDIKGICVDKKTVFMALNHLIYTINISELNDENKYENPLVTVGQETKISFIISKGNKLAIGTDNGVVKIYDIANTGSIILKKELIGHKNSITSISWLENEDLIVTSSEDGTVKIWNVAHIEGKWNSKEFKDEVDKRILINKN